MREGRNRGRICEIHQLPAGGNTKGTEVIVLKRQLILCAEQSLQINLPVSVLLVDSVMPSAESMYGEPLSGS